MGARSEIDSAESGRDLMTIEDVRVTVYTEEGRSFIILGKRGKVFLESKNMELAGDVTVTSSDGYRLKTQSVSYDHQGKRLGSSDAVEIEGDRLRVTGTGMVIDMEARTFKILGPVKTRLRAEGKV